MTTTIPAASDQTTTLSIHGMTCGACSGRVERALASGPGVRSATVDLAAATAAVVYDPRGTTPERLAEAVRGAGYEARAAATSGGTASRGRRIGGSSSCCCG